MGKNIEHIQHLRSNEVVNGQPKAPAANNLLDGEIAVNYAAGNETLFIKSSDGSNVKSFSNDDNFYKKGAISNMADSFGHVKLTVPLFSTRMYSTIVPLIALNMST